MSGKKVGLRNWTTHRLPSFGGKEKDEQPLVIPKLRVAEVGGVGDDLSGLPSARDLGRLNAFQQMEALTNRAEATKGLRTSSGGSKLGRKAKRSNSRLRAEVEAMESRSQEGEEILSLEPMTPKGKRPGGVAKKKTLTRADAGLPKGLPMGKRPSGNKLKIEDEVVGDAPDSSPNPNMNSVYSSQPTSTSTPVESSSGTAAESVARKESLRIRMETKERLMTGRSITRALSAPNLGSSWMDFDFLGIVSGVDPEVNLEGVAPHTSRSSHINEFSRSKTASRVLQTYSGASRKRPLPPLPRCKSIISKGEESNVGSGDILETETPYGVTRVAIGTEDGVTQINSGTLTNLMSMMFGDVADEQYVTCVLYGYRNVMKPEEFFDFLTAKFDQDPSKGEFSAEEREDWEQTVRRRIVAVLANWIRNHFYDFKFDFGLVETVDEDRLKKKLLAFLERLRKEDDPQLCQSAMSMNEEFQETDLIRRLHNGNVTMNNREDFVSQLVPKLWYSKLPSTYKVGQKMVKRCFTGAELHAWVMVEVRCHDSLAKGVCSLLMQKHLIHIPQNDRLFMKSEREYYTFVKETKQEIKQTTVAPLKPLGPADCKPNSLLDIHPVELARQLTLYESSIFRRITPLELFNQAWSSADESLSPNVMKLIKNFNGVSFWVATELVMNAETLKERQQVLKRMICVADVLRETKNFNAMMEITVGLNLGPVSRLTLTWERLPQKYQAIYDNLMEFSSSLGNYRNYRAALKEIPSHVPVLPYLAVYLRDLTFIADGNPKYLDDDQETINFHRIRMEARIMQEIQKYQQHEFPFMRNTAVQTYIKKSLDDFLKESELWERSKGAQHRDSISAVKGKGIQARTRRAATVNFGVDKEEGTPEPSNKRGITRGPSFRRTRDRPLSFIESRHSKLSGKT